MFDETPSLTMFNAALPLLLRFEGGLSDAPSDRGGLTNYGITQATFDAWNVGRDRPRVSVRTITDAEVREIYRELYWVPSGAHRFVGETFTLSFTLFDGAVNFGVPQGTRFLQRAINNYTRGGEKLSEDGIFGQKTEAAARSLKPRALVEEIVRLRIEYRMEIVKRNPSQAKFLSGWLSRDSALSTTI